MLPPGSPKKRGRDPDSYTREICIEHHALCQRYIPVTFTSTRGVLFYRNTVKLIPLEVTQFNMIYTAVNKEHKGIKIDGDKPTETFKIIYNGGRILFTQQRRMF